jgi:hypothetical protein
MDSLVVPYAFCRQITFSFAVTLARGQSGSLSSGTAQIDITNRATKQQNLTGQSVLGSYFEVVHNTSQFYAGVTPINQILNGYFVDINISLTNQQLIYSCVGLQVTLNYTGGLSLLSPIINQGSRVL